MKTSIKILIGFLILTNIVTGIFLLNNTKKANTYVSKYDSLASASELTIKSLKNDNDKLKSQITTSNGITGNNNITTKQKVNKPKTTAETVYICTGGYAYAYHSSSGCSGLNRCKGDIIQVTKQKAENMGRNPCKICY